MTRSNPKNVGRFTERYALLALIVGVAAAGCSGDSDTEATNSARSDGGVTHDASGDGGVGTDGSADGTLGPPPGMDATDETLLASCGNGTCDPGESCETCAGDCGDCPATCPNGECDPGESCSICPSDCGPCPDVCGGCPTGQQCIDGPGGPFCTACDPTNCAAYGVGCCPSNAPAAECTNWFTDPGNCGGCGVQCGAGQSCIAGACTTCTAGSGEADCLFKCSFDPMQWWRGSDVRDVTFIAVGDTHAEAPTAGCSENSAGGTDQNTLLRSAFNSAGEQPHVWPGGESFYREGQVYDHLRGTLIAGDLTQAGSEAIPAGTQSCQEYTAYRDAFGRCGSEGKLLFPVYDGYGNHDFPRNPAPGDVNYHPVIDYLDRITAAHRPGAASDLYDDPSPGTGHYAWQWDDIWFVNVNLKPGYNEENIEGTANNTMRIADPHHSRGFVQGFLLSLSNDASRQIVVMAHYPLSSSRIDDVEKESFCKLIHNAQNGTGSFTGQKLSQTNPIIAYIHGHTHDEPKYYEWTCPSPYQSITIPHFNVGTPLYEANNNGPGNLQFTVFRIGSHWLEVVGVRAPASNPTGAWTYLYKSRLGYPIAP